MLLVVPFIVLVAMCVGTEVGLIVNMYTGGDDHRKVTV